MVLFEPDRTQFDLSWRMLGVPVRVHPLFWLVACLLGAPWLEVRGVGTLLLWIGCMFVSILVHEFGHVIAARSFGNRSHVVLYAFGGLAIPDGVPYRRWQRVVIYLAGPAAGFVLYGIARVVAPYVLAEVQEVWVIDLFTMVFFMNLFWGLLNLLPIWPLDGGQVSRELFSAASARNGLRLSLGVSFLLAAVLALHCFLYSRGIQVIPFLYFGSPFSGILFAMLAVESFMMLQQEQQRRGPWDDDPWQRY